MGLLYENSSVDLQELRLQLWCPSRLARLVSSADPLFYYEHTSYSIVYQIFGHIGRLVCRGCCTIERGDTTEWVLDQGLFEGVAMRTVDPAEAR